MLAFARACPCSCRPLLILTGCPLSAWQLLQPGYSGSLVDNLVGFTVHYPISVGGTTLTMPSFEAAAPSRGCSPSLGPGTEGSRPSIWPSADEERPAHVAHQSHVSLGRCGSAAPSASGLRDGAPSPAAAAVEDAQRPAALDAPHVLSFATWCLTQPTTLHFAIQ